jgi:hypothetical protein
MPVDSQQEYEWLRNLELETTKFRYATFTALVSISFVVAGLAANATSTAFRLFGTDTNLSRVVFFLGFLFYLFAVFHYLWYHRYSHRYRRRLKQLEADFKITVYTLRERPRKGRLKLHFHFALYLIGVVYGVATLSYIGPYLFTLLMVLVVLGYFLLVLSTYFQKTEPQEE